MTNISFNLSEKIDLVILDILEVIHQEASALGILFFVVGATARDIVLNHCHTIKTDRATRDLDIGVEVDSWDEFQQLSKALVATGRFEATREQYRLKFGRFPVDIVPFGNVSPEGRTISWPPDQQVIMNIMGFKEAYHYGMNVRLSTAPLLDVKVPTIPGMALMKVISWNDRYPERSKDAEDLLFFMEHYSDAGNEDRMFDSEVELLQMEGFDLVLAGIRLLGRDMAAIADESTGTAILKILEAETGDQQRYRLVQDMAGSARTHHRSDEILTKIMRLKQGFLETGMKDE